MPEAVSTNINRTLPQQQFEFKDVIEPNADLLM